MNEQIEHRIMMVQQELAGLSVEVSELAKLVGNKNLSGLLVRDSGRLDAMSEILYDVYMNVSKSESIADEVMDDVGKQIFGSDMYAWIMAGGLRNRK